MKKLHRNLRLEWPKDHSFFQEGDLEAKSESLSSFTHLTGLLVHFLDCFIRVREPSENEVTASRAQSLMASDSSCAGEKKKEVAKKLSVDIPHSSGFRMGSMREISPASNSSSPDSASSGKSALLSLTPPALLFTPSSISTGETIPRKAVWDLLDMCEARLTQVTKITAADEISSPLSPESAHPAVRTIVIDLDEEVQKNNQE